MVIIIIINSNIHRLFERIKRKRQSRIKERWRRYLRSSNPTQFIYSLLHSYKLIVLQLLTTNNNWTTSGAQSESAVARPPFLEVITHFLQMLPSRERGVNFFCQRWLWPAAGHRADVLEWTRRGRRIACKDRELRQTSTWARRAHFFVVSVILPITHRRWFFVDFIAASQRSPKWNEWWIEPPDPLRSSRVGDDLWWMMLGEVLVTTCWRP